MHRIKIILQGIFWSLVYIILATGPLILLTVGKVPDGREFWRELSVALGFAGLSMLTLQFVLTARFKTIKAPYGADIVYHFHRQVSLVSFGLILLHPLLLFINDPRTLALLNLATAPWRARMGVTAVVLLLLLIGASLWRKALKIDYSIWRIWHGVLSIAVVALSMTHIVLARHYLNLPWKQALWIAYGIFWVGLLIYVRIVKPLLLLRTPYRVERVTAERSNTWTLTIKPAGHAGIKFMPGQFAWLIAGQSPFAEAEHPFSISSSAARSDSLDFTIKELGDFTRTIKDLRSGEKIYLDGPFGAFSIDRHPHAPQYAFIAGGVGITPIMSMLRTLADRGDQRPLVLIYANKEWEGIIFREELEALRKKLNLTLVHVLEKPPADWTGETGFINQSILDRYLPKEKARNAVEVFLCGPPPMMDAVETLLAKIGVPLGDFHSERFNFV
jgi:predicted ferric reductase